MRSCLADLTHKVKSQQSHQKSVNGVLYNRYIVCRYASTHLKKFFLLFIYDPRAGAAISFNNQGNWPAKPQYQETMQYHDWSRSDILALLQLLAAVVVVPFTILQSVKICTTKLNTSEDRPQSDVQNLPKADNSRSQSCQNLEDNSSMRSRLHINNRVEEGGLGSVEGVDEEGEGCVNRVK